MSTDPQTPTVDASAPSRRKPRLTRVGFVTSAGRDKTIRVTVSYRVRHPKYGKYIRRRIKLHAHDQNNECIVGDKVKLMQCRPISKLKSWRLVEIIDKAPGARGGSQ